ncbi:MAG: HAD family phosphatase [Planctomycetes bacterium]|nr:HAD family phosphatase [Planctomycetota bacterium]
MPHMYGLIFDVDGVIANTEPLNARVTIRVLKDMFGLVGVTDRDFEAGIGRGAEAYVKAGARAHGVELTDGQAQVAAQVRERYLIEALHQEPLPAFPGVLKLIQAGLDDPNFRLAIATSASRELSQAILESAGVPYQRMAYVSGSEVKKKKPDPGLFLTAAKRMSLPPGRCVVFEDAPSGVEAAGAAGSRCIAVTNSVPARELFGADVVCDSLERIDLAALRSLVDGD